MAFNPYPGWTEAEPYAAEVARHKSIVDTLFNAGTCFLDTDDVERFGDLATDNLEDFLRKEAQSRLSAAKRELRRARASGKWHRIEAAQEELAEAEAEFNDVVDAEWAREDAVTN